jgi:hypothetical protein
VGQSTSDILKLAGGAFVGALGSGYLSTMILSTSNSGIMGYAADAASTLIIAWAANKFVGSKVAEGAIAGGFGALLKRIYQENVSGTALSGHGDFLGAYGSRGFPLPTSTAGGAYQLQPAPGTAVAATPVQAGAIPGAVAGAGGRFGGRFTKAA